MTDGLVTLLSVDFGEMFTTSVDEISAVPPEPADLALLPHQAIECHLATALPIHGEWTEASGDLFWDLTGNSPSVWAQVRASKEHIIGNLSGVYLYAVPVDLAPLAVTMEFPCPLSVGRIWGALCGHQQL